MNASTFVKIVVFVPESHADAVREAMGKSGAGENGNYSFCTFSSKGIGRFQPNQGAHPFLGKVGKREPVAEERIETICKREKLAQIIQSIKDVHPYEEVAIDLYSLEEI